MKRVFDLLMAVLGLVVISPLLLVMAALIKVMMPGPVFHKAERVGRGGGTFLLIKFRSMRVGAEKAGPKITVQGDPRITPLGHWLRKFKVDELPQLINVVKGEMSLVGPRPEDPAYVRYYKADERQLLSVLPGITSPASLLFRDEEGLLTGPDWQTVYCKEVLPKKLVIELAYLKRRTFWTDLGILAQTILAVFR